MQELKSRPKRADHRKANRRRRGDIVEDSPHLGASFIIQSIALQQYGKQGGWGEIKMRGRLHVEKIRRVTADVCGLSTHMRAGTITHVDIR